ncbi:MULTISPECIES: hypothetical protein [unclassified Peribacillus]|uniref:hypothetical protein n=1 Tax=unclassified Peribacillus TaxID=2675266 RepID=UPI00366AF374
MKNRMETFKGSKHFRLNQVAEGIFAAISVPGTGSLGVSVGKGVMNDKNPYYYDFHVYERKTLFS